MSLDVIWAIALKDLRQFLRDRTLALFMFLLPVLQLVLLAQATAQGVNNLPIGVLDLDHSKQSRAFVSLLAASENFEIVTHSLDWNEGTQALESGEVYGLVIIPQDFATALYNPLEKVDVQAIVDGTNTIVASVVSGVTEMAMQRFVEQQGGRFGTTMEGGVIVKSSMRYNPTASGRPHTIIAQLGMITFQITLGVAALGLAREREIGTLEQLMVTPVQRHELLLGKVIPPALIGLFDFLVMSLIIRLSFKIYVRGPFLVLLAGTLLFILAEVAWGVMISSIAATQQQAILFVFIQAIIDMALSGYLVPVRDMPKIFGFLARFVPLQYYLTIIRSVILKGAGLSDVGPHLVRVALLAVAIAFIATHTIANRMD